MAEDALVRTEEWAVKEYQILPPALVSDIRSICRELRAAREAVIACRTGNRADSPVYDDFEYIAEKMKQAQ